MKSEPSAYSIEDLQKEKITIWDGVRNYQARNILREMKKGDLAFFYHSNCKPPAIVGLMEVVETNIVDPTQFDRTSDYFDVKSTPEKPRWHTVKVKFKERFAQPLPLETLKQKFNPDDFLVVKKGNRLSVMPVKNTIAQEIFNLTRTF
ncbi:EVE domain-containing protein [Cyanobacterium stanieri LEGE 03274]|uniref:EVE domain-containing protein n=1 Tax=Cyanobacterium stanieri LEGE 03274 TaxID=1828756 RepID=A0ABR9V8S4_9CHRO|nr:EVE domain-containing protein [Cyanobacterium stanieri]MBE9223551.1 EVE domain-containing protein [Cyanobacterium stanieri LEGE 03274]